MNSKSLYFVSMFLIASNVYGAQDFPRQQTDQDIKALINFMVSTEDKTGFSYKGTAGDLSGKILPLSYYNTPAYWGEYVCNLAENKGHCAVTDSYNAGDYTLTPDASKGGDLQAERINVNNGTDIYDAACWQIALALAAQKGLKSPDGSSLLDLAENQNKLLKLGYDGNAAKPTANDNRAYTKDDGTFTYNDHKIDKSKSDNAYFFRMVTRNWLSKDPFMGTKYENFITAENLPADNPDYAKGKVTWMDWKPITGENAWAFLIGPLQAAYIKYALVDKQDYVPLDSVAIQNALKILPAFRMMQSDIGGVYYAVKGSLGNEGSAQINPYEISVENNASLLSGLLMLNKILIKQPDQTNPIVKDSLKTINVLINGDGGLTTKGLLSFFKNEAWEQLGDSKGVFLQGGLAKPGDWQPTRNPKAVDVSTWGVTVLGQPLIDQWHGFGAAYNVWDSVKEWGIYTRNGELWGVGYSDDPQGKDVISAEWTAGAINMVRTLIVQYNDVAESNSTTYTAEQKAQAAQYVTNLKVDEASMSKHLLSLRTDNYVTEKAYDSVRPANYANLIPIPKDKLAFIYDNKRYHIPFGWFANPLPSTTSTSWAIMVDYNFNPFSLGGSYEPNQFPAGSPDAPVIHTGPLSHEVTVTIVNSFIDQHKNAQPIRVGYKTTDNNDWMPIANIAGNGQQVVTFLAKTSAIGTTFGGDNYYGLCTIDTGKLQTKADNNKGAPVTITAKWQMNNGPCDIN